jgi:hypothetical protein
MEDVGGSCNSADVSSDKKNVGNNEENSNHEDTVPGFKTFEEFRQVVSFFCEVCILHFCSNT